MKTYIYILIILFVNITHLGFTQEPDSSSVATPLDTSGIQSQQPISDSTIDLDSYNAIFDDKMLLEGYTKKYAHLSQDILLAMMEDDTLTSYRMAAAIRVFREKYAATIVPPQKRSFERALLRQLSRSESAFEEVEILYTLCVLDRYKYFAGMVPILIQKMDHYNDAVNEMAYNALSDITSKGERAREARIVFNTLRKVLFLSRKRLTAVKNPPPRLAQKIKLLRWSIKVLGKDEIKKLPSEVLGLL